MKREQLLALTGAYQTAAVVLAAAELDLFTELIKTDGARVDELAKRIDCDDNALERLLIATNSLGITTLSDDKYRVDDELKDALDSRTDKTIVPLLRHQATCFRDWSQLARSVKTGMRANGTPGVNGADAEFRDFILAMDVVARNVAPKVAKELAAKGLLNFQRMLDLGGASGSYARAFLEVVANPNAVAVIFDRASALNEARTKFSQTKFSERVEFYPGDFYTDPYPQDVDFVWISAIIHQQDSTETERMFRRSFDALRPGGVVAVRDFFLNEDGSCSKSAALFGLNMLARTREGKIYTARETVALLTKVGFQDAELIIPTDDMGAVVVAYKR